LKDLFAYAARACKMVCFNPFYQACGMDILVFTSTH
jgi:hypothetical protein